MKSKLMILLCCLGLVACSNTSAPVVTEAPRVDTQNEISTAIAKSETAIAEKTLQAPLVTPTLDIQLLSQAILSTGEINEMANRWAGNPLDDSANLQPLYCAIECLSLTWGGGADGTSRLNITLYHLTSRDQAINVFNEFKLAQVTETSPEIPLPDLVELPETTFMVHGEDGFFDLITREGLVIVSIKVWMPDLSEEQNVLFLNLFADRQIQKLAAAGY